MKPTSWKHLIFLLIAICLFSALQCTRSSISTLNVVIKRTRSMTAAADFTCFAVNVVGPGINSLSATTGAPDFNSYFNGSTCTYPGIGSSLVSVTGDSQEITLKVPAGKDRLVQVIGIETSNGCGDPRNFAELFRDVLSGAETSANFPTIAEVGRARLDLVPGQDDTRISISSTYTSSQKNMLTCAASSSSGNFTVTPSDLYIHTGGTVKFHPSGGSGNYSFSITAGSSSTVSGDGTYTAQVITSNATLSETLTVTDTSTNEVVTRAITIFDPRLLSEKPIVWLRGDNFSVSGTALWTNSVSSPTPLFSVLSSQNPSDNPTLVTDNDLRGFPVVTFSQSVSTVNRMEGLVGGVTRQLTKADIYLVEKRTDLSDLATTGHLLCLTEAINCSSATSQTISLNATSSGGTTYLVGKTSQVPSSLFTASLPLTSVSAVYRIHRLNWSIASGSPGLTYQATSQTAVAASPAPGTGTFALSPGTAKFFLGYDGTTAALSDPNKRYAGSIAEVLMFDDKISPSNDGHVMSYLKAKYGLTF